MSDDQDILIDVKNVKKKFCRELKRSLWYGVKDMAGEMLGRGEHSHEQLRKKEFFAVNDVSFQVRRGECLGLIGGNGAGKSTMLKMLNGLIKPDAGSITMRGRVGALIELGAGFNPILTGRENIFINGSVLGLSNKEIKRRFDEIIDFAQVEEFIDTPVQNYSNGMRVRLGFAVAAHMSPDVLLIDEVLAVGDVNFRMKCFRHLSDLMQQGTTIVLVTHQINILSRITDRAVAMHKGVLRFDGALSKAIAVYEESVAEAIQHSRNKNGNEEIHSDSVRRVRCDVCNEDNELQLEFNTGDTVRLKLKITCPRAIEGARFNLFIESPSVGILGSFSSRISDFTVDLCEGETVVYAEIKDIPLLVGNYVINAAVLKEEKFGVLALFNSIGNFQVIGPDLDANGNGFNGIFRFDAEWSKEVDMA